MAGYIAKSMKKFTPQKSSQFLVNVKPLIVYGTETGNAKSSFKVTSKVSKEEKLHAKSVDIFQFDVKN